MKRNILKYLINMTQVDRVSNEKHLKNATNRLPNLALTSGSLN